MDLFHLVHVFAGPADSDGGEGEVSDRHGGSLQRRYHLHTQGPISEHGQNGYIFRRGSASGFNPCQ